jgi:hypothetical protein
MTISLQQYFNFLNDLKRLYWCIDYSRVYNSTPLELMVVSTILLFCLHMFLRDKVTAKISYILQFRLTEENNESNKNYPKSYLTQMNLARLLRPYSEFKLMWQVLGIGPVIAWIEFINT